MTRKARWAVAMGALAVVAVLSLIVVAQPFERPMRAPESGQGSRRVGIFSPIEYPGGYLKITYTVRREGVTLAATSSTEVIPQGDGTYRIINQSEEIVPEMRVQIGFYGIPLRGLGVYVAEDTVGVVDLSPLAAIEEEEIEPGRVYLLPDGGRFETGEAGTLAGVAVVFGTYTHADYANVKIEVAIASDLEIRNILPFLPLMELHYAPEAGLEDAAEFIEFSSVELSEFIWER